MSEMRSIKQKYLYSVLLPSIVVATLLLALLLFLITHPTYYYETTDIDMYLTVGDYIGFNVGTDALYFGVVMRGGVGQRDLEIDNEKDTPAKVEIYARGDFAKWVTVSNNKFTMPPNSNATVTVYVKVPQYAQLGDYDGTLRVTMKRERFEKKISGMAVGEVSTQVIGIVSEGKMRVNVTDATTKAALPNASIEVWNDNYVWVANGTANENGTWISGYLFTGLTGERYILNVTKVNYYLKTVSVYLYNNTTTNVSVALNPIVPIVISPPGGGGTTTAPVECIEDWVCSDWSDCIDGLQTRECIDINRCGTKEHKPLEKKICYVPTCLDGILNQQEEKVKQVMSADPNDISDCGGPNCPPCPTCFDKVQNQLEEGVDCGGPCLPCIMFEKPKEAVLYCGDGICSPGEERTCAADCKVTPWTFILTLLVTALAMEMYIYYGPKKKRRKLSWLFMIILGVIVIAIADYLYYITGQEEINWLLLIGGTIAFVLVLVLSGIGMNIRSKKFEEEKEKKRKIISNKVLSTLEKLSTEKMDEHTLHRVSRIFRIFLGWLLHIEDKFTVEELKEELDRQIKNKKLREKLIFTFDNLLDIIEENKSLSDEEIKDLISQTRELVKETLKELKLVYG